MVADRRRRLEIITPIPTAMQLCGPCQQAMRASMGEQAQQEMAQEYPAEFLEEFSQLMSWIDQVATRFGENLQIRVVDPQSLEGVWKSLRYGVRRYPAFVVHGQRRIVVWDAAAAEQALSEA